MENQQPLAIDLNDSNDIEEKIQKICRQTNYDYETAKLKIEQHNGDEIFIIRDFLGIAEKKAPSEVKSVNQEIYRQLRSKLDTNMREYKVRVEKGEAKNLV